MLLTIFELTFKAGTIHTNYNCLTIFTIINKRAFISFIFTKLNAVVTSFVQMPRTVVQSPIRIILFAKPFFKIVSKFANILISINLTLTLTLKGCYILFLKVWTVVFLLKKLEIVFCFFFGQS